MAAIVLIGLDARNRTPDLGPGVLTTALDRAAIIAIAGNTRSIPVNRSVRLRFRYVSGQIATELFHPIAFDAVGKRDDNSYD